MARAIVDGHAYRRPTTLGPWTTLMDNLMDGYAPVHEVSHRELPTGFPKSLHQND